MKIKIVGIILLSLVLTGCFVTSRSGRVYSRDETRIAHSVEWGTVVQVENVLIEGTKSGIGAAIGGVTGGVAGSTAGRGDGTKLATVGGALAGAALGSLTEDKLTQDKGLEITLKLETGKTIVIVQEADEFYKPGERVRIVKSPNGVLRVRKAE